MADPNAYAGAGRGALVKAGTSMTLNFELAAGPFQGRTGGLVWNGSAMLFSAVMEEKIFAFEPSAGRLTEFRRYTGRTNGLAMAPDGSVFGAQEGGRRIIRFLPDGSTVPTCDLIDGQHHNQPSDIAADSVGRFWFTDPFNPVLPFGPDGIYPFLPHASVLRLQRDQSVRWSLSRVTFDTVCPRALALSSDQRTLYVADGDADQSRGPCTLRAYPIDEMGQVGAARLIHRFADGERGFEGLCVDRSGFLIASGGQAGQGRGPAVYVFSPGGEILAVHPIPADRPMRCALGDATLDTLYVTTHCGRVFRSPQCGYTGTRLGPIT
jgi:gluconolactonase